MRFGSRRAAPAATRAAYAAIVSDRWLWVALSTDDALSVHGAGGALELPAELDEQPGRHGTRLDLTWLPTADREQRFVVHVADGPLLGEPTRRSGPGTTFALASSGEGHLEVVRRPSSPAGPGAVVRAMRLVGDAVEIDLEVPGAGERLVLADSQQRTLATLPLDGSTATLRPEHLDGVAAGDLAVLLWGQPVRRRRNLLADPGGGALLPPVHAATAVDPRGRLRWAADGTLVVRVFGEPT